ncbi:MAG: dihydrofolate reductase family protein [Bacteroidetes bacterium]|jgi:dihydrofolate reductase|nr:dihydrofolate reductase family protein [Bacteroidota bacterium]
MRKLKLQVQITIDGFISGPNGEMDWLTFNWSPDLNEYVTQLTDPVDTILLGRNLAEGFIPHWTNALTNAEPEPGADKMVNTPKVVFTKTLEKSVWENTVLAKGDLVKEINALKQKPGGDMIVYGGGKFVSSLIKEKLIDELHLFINPAVIGNGMTIFASVTEKQNYQLLNVKSFDCGIVVLTYKTI